MSIPRSVYIIYIYIYIYKIIYIVYIIYRMDLNFRGTKLSRIENFRVIRVFISRMRVPQYYIKYIDYISVLICS